MCIDCGCGEIAEHSHPITHSHGGTQHTHTHTHDGSTHTHPGDTPVPDAVKNVEQKILARNDAAAAENREWLEKRGITAVNIISSPGSGKTMLLEQTLKALNDSLPCAVITGDQQTDNDARRLSGKGAPVRQIITGNACHLDAATVGETMRAMPLEDTKLLFIENVGNLVCPAAFELGENFKVALHAVTEGEDKPLKYPALFHKAAVTVITKTDLAKAVEWDASACRKNIQRVHPGMVVFELSAKTAQGMSTWIDYLKSLVI